MMKVLSLSVGRPRLVVWDGEPVSTGIYKTPVGGRVMLRTLNLDGDRQADLTVHGGPSKAAYAYPSEHYAFWRDELPGVELPWGMFGENFTTEGLDESSVNIGDRFRLGAAEVTVTQPRMPCYKLAVKFQRADILKHPPHNRRSQTGPNQATNTAPGPGFSLRPSSFWGSWLLVLAASSIGGWCGRLRLRSLSGGS